MGGPQRTLLWFGAAVASTATLVGLGRVAGAPRRNRLLATLSSERMAHWLPDVPCGTVEDSSGPCLVAGGTCFAVLRRRLSFASAEAARTALTDARHTAVADGWERDEDAGWQKPAANADLGLHLDGDALVVTLRSYRRAVVPVMVGDESA